VLVVGAAGEKPVREPFEIRRVSNLRAASRVTSVSIQKIYVIKGDTRPYKDIDTARYIFAPIPVIEME
jgi:hypothetical protein